MKTVIDWFLKSVNDYPHRIFLQEQDKEISYYDFWLLMQKKITYINDYCKPFQPIAILMDKSIELVSWMLAIAYCGSCYCVLDSRHGQHRLSKMINQLQANCILCSKEYLSLISEYKPICVEEINYPKEREIMPRAYSNAPLYINFTSGSTGQPKGVAVSHRSVVDFIPVFCQQFNFQKDDCFANQAPLDFDVSVKDIYSAMYLGARVVLIPREYFSNPMQLMDLLCDKQVTILVWAVSALCFVSIMNGLKYRLPNKIRAILFSGEVMPMKHLQKWMTYLPHAMYVNLYGPTEITCNCTYEIINATTDLNHLSIGKAFANEWVFLLDDNDQLVNQAKQVGEICVSGDCLALGYWHNAEKTAQSFPLNPLVSGIPIRMYRTGDLAYYDEKGCLFFQGRKDFQIKHLGHRIELGEIEAMMQEIKGCERACVVYDQKRSRIEAYFEGTIGKEALTHELKDKIPSYMMPNHIHQLEHLPLTKNGKIDRQLLKGE